MAAASSSSLAAPSLPPSSLTANTEKANYIRLSRLLVDIGTAVLQEVFDSFHPSPTLHGVLTSPKVNTKLQKLRAKNILNTVQWDILYPPAASGVVTSKRFDITLLFLLLRNICKLKKPSTGWDKDPSPTDHSMSADVLRIKMSRNKIYAHAINLALNKNEFDRCWAETEEALIRLDVTNHVKPKIQSLRVLPLDIENDECYKVLLRGLEDKEDKTFDALAKISKDVQQLKEEKHSKSSITIRGEVKIIIPGGIVLAWAAGSAYFVMRYRDDPDTVIRLVKEAILPSSVAVGSMASILHILLGSFKIIVGIDSLQALDVLWQRYKQGQLKKDLQDVIVTDKLRQLAKEENQLMEKEIEDVVICVSISEHDYIKASKELKEGRKEVIADVSYNAEERPSKHGLPNKNYHFVGRDAVVLSLANLLTVKNKRMVVILGPPGCGKSTLVSHIGHDLYKKQKSVIFVSLRQITTMDLLCTSILKTIDSGSSKSDNVIEQAQNLLTSFITPTVLILDNCEDLQKSPSCSDFQNFIEYVGNHANNLQLLLGTRKPLSSISFESHTEHLHRLEDPDSTKLLEALAPGKFQGDEAKTLGERCRGIPLLIKLAAARVKNGYKPSKLAEDLRSRPYEVFKHKGDDIQDYLLNSIRVFLDSLNRELLLSLVRLSNFPNDFIEEQIGEVYKGDWSDTLCSLRANGLVHLECEHYSLHPLLQTFCREEQDRMGCAEEGTQARRAFTLHYLKKLENICRKFVSKDFQLALKEFEHDRMNIQQALENSIKFQCKDIEESCINACNNSVNFLGQIMPPRQCLEIYHLLYDMASSQKNTRQMAECLASLGFVHLCDGNHRTFSKEAMESFEEAYKLFKIVSKSKRKSEAFAHCLSKLGLCYIAKGIEENEQKKGQQKEDPPKRDRPKGFQQMGDRQKGKKLMQDAINLRKELGDQVYLAASHCDRAIAARLIGEHSQAITILKEECYPIYKDNLGDHPWVATVLNYISDSYKVLGKLEDAKENTKKSLDIRKRTLGDHQDTARSYVHLAELLRLQGEDYLSGALENYQKALSIQEKVLGVDKETAASCKAIAEILEELEPEDVPAEMKKRADSFTEAIKKRVVTVQRLSRQQNEIANSHLQIIVVVFAILVSYFFVLDVVFKLMEILIGQT